MLAGGRVSDLVCLTYEDDDPADGWGWKWNTLSRGTTVRVSTRPKVSEWISARNKQANLREMSWQLKLQPHLSSKLHCLTYRFFEGKDHTKSVSAGCMAHCSSLHPCFFTSCWTKGWGECATDKGLGGSEWHGKFGHKINWKLLGNWRIRL